MRREQQIRINELLLQREELFLRIHAIEQEVTRILGEPPPLPRPALPSDVRPKRKAPAGRSPRADAPPSLRKLESIESAYRVTYHQFDREHIEIHPDSAALATLLACQGAHLRVTRIETLDAEGSACAVLL